MPRVKITDILTDVDAWTDFTRHFVHLKHDVPAEDRTLLLSALLADGIDLGFAKMSQASPGATYQQLSRFQAWHVRDETYTAGLAELVNAWLAHRFAAQWGDGTTSASDGQRFGTGHRGEGAGQVNPRYGHAPGRLFYTHVSDRYAPFSGRIVNAGRAAAVSVTARLGAHQSDRGLRVVAGGGTEERRVPDAT